MNTQDNYVSLFDYLGKASGGELGKQVFQAAKKARIRMQTREVSNPKYTGKIMLYPKTFLDQYFSDNKVEYNVY